MPQKILIVEDERLVAQHISQLLTANNYEVCAIAADATTALKKIAEFYPDLILLDICIKGDMDGIEIVERIQFLYDIPAIFLTALSDAETLKRAQQASPAGYIVKPFRREQLLSSVVIALANHEAKHKQLTAQLPTLTKEAVTENVRLQPILSYIQDNLNQGITVEFLSGAIGMSPAYFCRFFQKEMGCSPYQYIIQQRIEKAKILLKQRDLSINDIALACGFTSHSQLDRHFRNMMGITPKDYRNG